jgi:hypothetical protein
VTLDEYETLGVIEAGVFRLQERDLFNRAMKRFADGPVVVSVKTTKPQRSGAQNRYWHGVVIPLFADHCGYEFDEMKDALALKLLPKEIADMNGEIRIVPGHTSHLNVQQFNELIERAQRLGAEMEIYVPDPGEAVA